LEFDGEHCQETFPARQAGVYVFSQLALMLGRGWKSTIVFDSGQGLRRSAIRSQRSLSSIVKAWLCAAMVSQSVGYDAGKKIKGRKRFITVDTLGLVLRVLITAASVPERSGGFPSAQARQTNGRQGFSLNDYLD